MNKIRRSQLREVLGLLTKAVVIIDSVCDQEETAIENYPENLQDTDRFAAMEDNVCELEDVSSILEEAKNKIENVIR